MVRGSVSLLWFSSKLVNLGCILPFGDQCWAELLECGRRWLGFWLAAWIEGFWVLQQRHFGYGEQTFDARSVLVLNAWLTRIQTRFLCAVVTVLVYAGPPTHTQTHRRTDTHLHSLTQTQSFHNPAQWVGRLTLEFKLQEQHVMDFIIYPFQGRALRRTEAHVSKSSWLLLAEALLPCHKNPCELWIQRHWLLIGEAMLILWYWCWLMLAAFACCLGCFGDDFPGDVWEESSEQPFHLCQLYSSLANIRDMDSSKVEQLCLDFTLPGWDAADLGVWGVLITSITSMGLYLLL